MKIAINELPDLKVNGQAVTVSGNLSELSGHNSAMISSGIRLGDVIEFPEDEASIHTGSYPIRPLTGDPQTDEAIPRAKGLFVWRNGKLDFFSPNCLAVRNQHNEPFNYVDEATGDVVTPEFNKQMCLLADTPARIQELLGKKITCKQIVTIKQKKFQSEELKDSRVAVIEYA